MATRNVQHATPAPNAPRVPPPKGESAGDLFEALIDRIADRVVEKLEEQRKIDLIAGAVIQRIRLGPHHQEATREPNRTNSGT